MLPATWPSRPDDGLKLHGEETLSRKRIQSLWNWLKMMEQVGVRLCFEGKSIRLGDEVIDEEREWKPMWRKVKTCLQKAMESRRIENYKTKEQQSQFYQEQEDECYCWFSQKLHGRKTSSIMTILEQMVETRL